MEWTGGLKQVTISTHRQATDIKIRLLVSCDLDVLFKDASTFRNSTRPSRPGALAVLSLDSAGTLNLLKGHEPA